jgi:hypothetical protein
MSPGPILSQHLGSGPSLVVVLALAGAGSLVVVGLAVVAVARRRSRSYLLVAAAFGALAARTAVAGLSLGGLVGTDLHHLLEHGLDVAMVGLVIGAVYYARTVERRLEPEEP